MALSLLGFALFCLLLAAAPTASAMVTLTATDAGFVTSAGGSAKGDGTVVPAATFNYSVGWEVHYMDGSLGVPPGSTPLTAMVRNNYFVFDLTSVTTTILSATFIVNAGTYESSGAAELLELYSPGSVAAALMDADSLLAASAIGTTSFDMPSDPAVGVAMMHFGNLTGGPIIGAAPVSMADDDMDLMISIAPGFLNAHLGSRVVFGGALSSLTMAGTPEAIMGFTGPDIAGGTTPLLVPKLELTLVPEPGRGILLLLGAATAIFRRRRPN